MPSRKRAIGGIITLIALAVFVPIFLLSHGNGGGGAVLHVSLPSGIRLGEDADPWLNEGWLLNLTGTSQTFTVRINNTSAAKTSFDTHLIIALNDAGYGYLENLKVNEIEIPKSAFRCGVPKPYGIWTWPAGDVYPTWFNDTYIIGDIPAKGCRDVTVSVTFSNATGVRMHFDVYGSSTETVPPTKPGDITRNPLSEDSTILIQPETPTPPPPTIKYYLTVKTVPANITKIQGEGWYENCTYVELIAPSYIYEEAHPNTERYIFTHWTIDDASVDGNPIVVHMNANHTAIAHYIKQYLVIFDQTGLDNTATGPVVTVNDTEVNFAQLPLEIWVDECSWINYVYKDMIQSTVIGKRFKLTDVDGPASPLHVDSPLTVIGNYKTQYYLTVKVEPPNITTIPGEGWYDKCTNVELTAPTVKDYKFDYWDIDGTLQDYKATITVHMNVSHIVTAHYSEIPLLSVSISPTTAKIKVGESLTFTSTVSGGTSPYSYQWYLNETAIPEATSSTWKFTPNAPGIYTLYLKITDSLGNTAKSNNAQITVAPPLKVSISPLSASLIVGQTVTFTSTVSGGYTPYSYQWYLNGIPISGATSDTWNFTPTESGIFYIQLKVTDANGNTAQSETARVTAITVPVGGYSIPIITKTNTEPTMLYITLITILTITFAVVRRKEPKNKQ